MKLTPEERILAVISHLSALAMGMGMVVPVALWASQRGKSRYAAFQALQAYGYQSLGYTIYLLFMLLVFVLVFIALFFIALLVPNASRNDAISSVFVVILMVTLFASQGIYLLFPILAAIFCGLGRDFHYPLIGHRLAAFFHSPANSADEASLDPAAEERWLASMGHFAVIQPIWGLVGPLYLWLSEGKRSPYLRFQSAQTVLYQALFNLLYLGTFILSFLLLFLTFSLTSMTHSLGGEGAALAGLMVMTCCMGPSALIVPLFHILGQWAGLRVLQGHDFRYPLLGRLIENRLSK